MPIDCSPLQNEISPTKSAKILVVDDNPTYRLKLSMVVQKLGFISDAVDDGKMALKALRTTRYEALLLDIIMPNMDGFEVLRVLKSDKELRDIPIIVVSGLNDTMDNVVRAIELGAEDFLPKDFDPILLNARLSTCLTKRKYQNKQREYFQRVDKLTHAAAVLESGRFNPQNLAIDDLAEQPDPLGKLAAVFRGMAHEIYQRELRLKRTIHLLQGSMLVIAVGLVWGLTPALSRMSSSIGSNPLGLAVWVNGIAAVLCFSVAICRRKLPWLNKAELLFFLYWALLAGILQRLTTFLAATHVEASVLSLIVTLQGVMVFAFAAITKLEKATPRRLSGLIVGLIGVAILLIARFDQSNATQNVWLLFALLLSLLFAVEAIVLAGRHRPIHIDIFASVGFMMALSTLFLVPMAYLTGNLLSLGPEIGRLELVVFLMGVVVACSLLLTFHLIAKAGAVFYSQSAYAMTIAGIVWGMLLLDEQLSLITWFAFAVILFGLHLQ